MGERPDAPAGQRIGAAGVGAGRVAAVLARERVAAGQEVGGRAGEAAGLGIAVVAHLHHVELKLEVLSRGGLAQQPEPLLVRGALAAEEVRRGEAARHGGYRTRGAAGAAREPRGGSGEPRRGAALALAPDQAIGVFDSGVGGLTVLDECLAALPAEDFVYFGDTAFFPYGERSEDELRRRSLAIARWLADQGVKLIVVACNTATAAVLPWLQRQVAIPVIGVMGPEAHAAVQATRNRRIGLLATEATVRSGSYPRMVLAHDAGAAVTSVACPRLAPAIQSGDPFGQEIVDMVREYARPLVDAGVDTVILGCTHYPMVERLLRRSLPGVTLIKSGEEIAREVADTLARKGLARPAGREGGYRFACSGDPDLFRELGSRFLQMPLGDVLVVDPEAVTAPSGA